MDGVTTTRSGRATPAAAASSDESTDNYELGAEAPGEEVDATTTTTTAATEDAVMAGPDADAATDNLVARFANLNSPADRYVCFPFQHLRDDRANSLTVRFSISHVSISAYRAPPVIVPATFTPFSCIPIAFWVGIFLCSLSHSLCPPSHTRGVAALEQRLNFTRNSIGYLFRTTYTPADSLTIAALVAYMNAALPPDKHEEFDTAEVTRAAKTLHDRGSVAFEGDMLKPL
jgi:hypothetical protein